MLSIALAQDDFHTGDVAGSAERVAALAVRARDELGADLIIFPEQALGGPRPGDLLLRRDFSQAVARAVSRIAAAASGIDVIVGHPHTDRDGKVFNALSWLRDGQVAGRGFQQNLSAGGFSADHRYFSAGSKPLVISIKGASIAVLAGADLSVPGPAAAARRAGASLVVAAAAEPFYDGVLDQRRDVLNARHRETGLPLLFLNAVGGHDEVVFDGRSMVIDGSGRLSGPAPVCSEALLQLTFSAADGRIKTTRWPADGGHEENGDGPATIWAVLKRGLRDYVHKNGFSSVVLGLSGGMDSALTLALAADALGPENVHGIMMPSRHTSELSLILASEQSVMLGTHHDSISIEPVYSAQLRQLEEPFAGRHKNHAEENLQARIRGSMIMALSNKFGHLALAPGNKSELAVGYTTIYGDMCGGYSPLKDVFKTRVYELANWRNSLSPAVPQGVIDRPPSAELADGQLDQDRLPPYETLDDILARYVEREESVDEISAAGFDAALVRRVARMVRGAEFKRRQGAPGPAISRRSFGGDRRFPLTSGWRDPE
ncbi:MAG TPA: NAD+ synthase [Wenzhouxiangella sp.]|nr:NAD+ synthase [Wenzhouxiangella sp.]